MKKKSLLLIFTTAFSLGVMTTASANADSTTDQGGDASNLTSTTTLSLSNIYNKPSLSPSELETSQMLIGGAWQHHDYSTIGSQAVKKGLSGKHWYTVKRYTAKNAGHAYVKVVAKVYSNAARTHLLTSLEEDWRA
ncbi:hypothetical protein [Levilactobacillus spicheri]|uniref:Uncharacterized protein n=1 Tax=Levilactobacillus spicheri TaxID=216463 RepID=A0A0F3RPS0_9LACO|nr:hypothetical protein [Levilactobacillus spicheri]KJW11594.1 hypothetical protein VC81_12335 [Levilactobacillus spicheri]